MLFRSFAYDSYRRFIQMFSDVVMEIPKSFFERVLDEIKESKGAKYDTDLNAEDMKEIVVRFKEIYKEKMGVEFPQDPKVQLMEAIKAGNADLAEQLAHQHMINAYENMVKNGLNEAYAQQAESQE